MRAAGARALVWTEIAVHRAATGRERTDRPGGAESVRRAIPTRCGPAGLVLRMTPLLGRHLRATGLKTALAGRALNHFSAKNQEMRRSRLRRNHRSATCPASC